MYKLDDILNELSSHDCIQIDDNKFRVSTDIIQQVVRV